MGDDSDYKKDTAQTHRGTDGRARGVISAYISPIVTVTVASAARHKSGLGTNNARG